jgi:hypothetical protein
MTRKRRRTKAPGLADPAGAVSPAIRHGASGAARADEPPGPAPESGPAIASTAARADLVVSPGELTGDGAVADGAGPVVRRTPEGWRVGGDDLPDLTCAMVLADLIAAELPTQIQPSVGEGGPAAEAPPVPPEEEARRLRTTVGQLEHALAARIRIEQAIGVLAERNRIRPRQAFEQLRSAARNRGRKVMDIATDVVASATNPLLQLPEELSRQRSGPRHRVPHEPRRAGVARRAPRGAHDTV